MWRLFWVKRDGAGARTRSEPWWLRHLPTARRSTALRAGITSVEARCFKIDGSFIKSVESGGQAAAIVRSVLGLGRGLNLPVLAEGVETSAELGFLESELCDEAQGYLLGKPADIESYRRLTHGGEAIDERPAVIHLKTKVSSM
jgi:EAL domain